MRPSRAARLALVLLPALAALAPAVARAAEPTRLPLEAKDVPTDRTRWYGLYVGGKKNGHLRETIRVEGDVAVFEGAMKMEMKALGQTVSMDVVDRHEFDAKPPFALRGASLRMTQPNGTLAIDVRKKADGTFAATTSSGGAERTLEMGALDYTLADVLSLERWFREPRAVGDTVTTRTLDLQEARLDLQTAQVEAVHKGPVQGVETTWYETAISSEKKGRVGVGRIDTTGGLVSIQLGSLMELRSEPEEQAKRLEEAGDAFVAGVARLEGSIGKGKDVGRVEELVLEANGKGVPALRTAPRQSVEPAGDGKATLRLGAGHGEPDAATEEEIREALAETVEFPVNDPRVRAAAAEAVGPAKTALEKTERLVRWVSRHLRDEICVEWVSAERLLDRKAGDCSEHALLFTTLARAAGVPARTVSGLMYMGDEIQAFGGHAWNEVVIDGHWVPVDATHDQLSLDATHVVFAREGRENDFLQASGGLSFRLVSVVLTPKRGGEEESDEPENPVVPGGGSPAPDAEDD